jgi:hypothetical protein
MKSRAAWRPAAHRAVRRGPVQVRQRPVAAVAKPAESAAKSRPSVVTWGAMALCVVTPLLIAAGASLPARAVASLLFICLVPGCTVATLVGFRSPAREIGVVVAAGLAVTTLAAEIMVAMGAWNAVAATDVLAVVCLVVMAVFAVRPRGNTHAAVARIPASMRRLGSRVNRRTALRWLGTVPTRHLLVLLAALGLWLLALQQSTIGQLSGYGLLSGLPVTYYAVLALLVAGFCTAAVASSPRVAILGAYVLMLILVLHGTTAVLYPEPRYTWVYKHLGVIDYIATHGSVNRDIDIYQNWPGFFALNAWFAQISGWKPLDYAAWAQVFFEILNVAALVFALRGLTRDSRRIWIAVWIFLWANWIGQDYLAPQAFGFFEGLVVIGLVLRSSQRNWPPRTWMGRTLSSVLIRGQRGSREPRVIEGRVPLAMNGSAAVVLGALCFLADVISHQLTPVILCAAVVVLTAARWCRPVWIPVAMSAVTLVWMALAWPFVSAHFQILSFALPRAQTPPVLTGSPTLFGVAYVRFSEVLITGFMLTVALVEGFLEWRDRMLPIAVVGLALAPFAIALVQPYGGESTLRAYLFALPWLAFLAASTARSAAGGLSARARRWGRPITLAALTAGLAAPFLFAYFGQESQNFITADDVAVNQWYSQHAPTGSVINFTAPNSPTRLNGRYAVMDVADAGSTLTDDPALLGHQFHAADLTRVETIMRSRGRGAARYLVISPSETNYLLLYGLVPPGWTENLVSALRASNDFRLVYSSGPAAVFQLVGRAATG